MVNIHGKYNMRVTVPDSDGGIGDGGPRPEVTMGTKTDRVRRQQIALSGH